MDDASAHRTSTPGPGPAPRYPWALIAVAGWVLPGLAHALLGDRRRGAIVGCALLSTFVTGLLIGGIDVVDRRHDVLWFTVGGQCMIGPLAFGVDAIHNLLDRMRDRQIDGYARDNDRPTYDREQRNRLIVEMRHNGRRPAYSTSVGHPNEVGTLFCAVAGMMNLLAILDAVGRATGRATTTLDRAGAKA